MESRIESTLHTSPANEEYVIEKHYEDGVLVAEYVLTEPEQVEEVRKNGAPIISTSKSSPMPRGRTPFPGAQPTPTMPNTTDAPSPRAAGEGAASEGKG